MTEQAQTNNNYISSMSVSCLYVE